MCILIVIIAQKSIKLRPCVVPECHASLLGSFYLIPELIALRTKGYVAIDQLGVTFKFVIAFFTGVSMSRHGILYMRKKFVSNERTGSIFLLPVRFL